MISSIRFDAAERLHRQRPVGRLGNTMDPAVMVVGDRGKRRKFIEATGLVAVALLLRYPCEIVKGQTSGRILLGEYAVGERDVELGSVGAGHGRAVMVDPENTRAGAREAGQMLGRIGRGPGQVRYPDFVGSTAGFRLD